MAWHQTVPPNSWKSLSWFPAGSRRLVVARGEPAPPVASGADDVLALDAVPRDGGATSDALNSCSPTGCRRPGVAEGEPAPPVAYGAASMLGDGGPLSQFLDELHRASLEELRMAARGTECHDEPPSDRLED